MLKGRFLRKKVVRCAAIIIQNSEYAVHLKMEKDATLGAVMAVRIAEVVFANLFLVEDNAIVTVKNQFKLIHVVCLYMLVMSTYIYN